MGSQGELSHFLGCSHHVSEAPLPGEPLRKCIEFDMKSYVRDCLASYHELTTTSGPLRGTPTPFLTEESTGTEPPGQHGNIARCVLAKMLYCARLARPDWMFAINLLTRKLTVWDIYCDKAFNRLMCYATQTQNYTLKGHVGSEPLVWICTAMRTTPGARRPQGLPPVCGLKDGAELTRCSRSTGFLSVKDRSPSVLLRPSLSR